MTRIKKTSRIFVCDIHYSNLIFSFILFINLFIKLYSILRLHLNFRMQMFLLDDDHLLLYIPVGSSQVSVEGLQLLLAGSLRVAIRVLTSEKGFFVNNS